MFLSNISASCGSGGGSPLDVPAVGTSSPSKSEYEKKRDKRVARNKRILAGLEVDSYALMATTASKKSTSPNTARKQPVPAAKKRRRSAASALPPRRRSGRSRGAAPDYTGERVDTFGVGDGTKHTAALMGQSIIRLVLARGATKTICPSEAARAVGKALEIEWRGLMPLARAAGARLVARGAIEATQKGIVIPDILSARGPIRFRLVAGWSPPPAELEAVEDTKALRISGPPKRSAVDAVTARLGAAEWLAKKRGRLEAALKASEGLAALPKSSDAAAWKALAVAKWGLSVELAEAEAAKMETNTNTNTAAATSSTSTLGGVDWETFVLSRQALPVGPTATASSLLQERYSDDPYRLLSACNLMSRVTSASTKERCIEAYFARCPTPSSLLALAAGDASGERGAATIRPLIASLGLFDNRFSSLLDIATAICSRPIFACDLKGMKIRGIGPFGVDSYRMWIRREGKRMRPGDRNLESYCAELRRE